MELRNLSLDNIQWVVETAAVRMLKEELERPELVNIDSLWRLMSVMLRDGTCWVVEDDGECVGVLGSVLTPSMFNHNYMTLAEVFWYVLPEFRQTRAGVLLLNAVEKKAEEVADELIFSLLPASPLKDCSLEKRGYKMVEKVFRKEY